VNDERDLPSRPNYGDSCLIQLSITQTNIREGFTAKAGALPDDMKAAFLTLELLPSRRRCALADMNSPGEALTSAQPMEVEMTKLLTLGTTVLFGSWIGVEAYVVVARLVLAAADMIETAARAS
jgi:hypothetical protein